jgi:hypothetical protein
MLKDSIRHPLFRLGLLTIVLIIISVPFRVSHPGVSDIILILAVLFIVIDWIFTLRLIMRNPFLDARSKLFWMVTITLLPAIGSMIYIMLENRKFGI